MLVDRNEFIKLSKNYKSAVIGSRKTAHPINFQCFSFYGFGFISVYFLEDFFFFLHFPLAYKEYLFQVIYLKISKIFHTKVISS